MEGKVGCKLVKGGLDRDQVTTSEELVKRVKTRVSVRFGKHEKAKEISRIKRRGTNGLGEVR